MNHTNGEIVGADCCGACWICGQLVFLFRFPLLSHSFSQIIFSPPLVAEGECWEKRRDERLVKPETFHVTSGIELAELEERFSTVGTENAVAARAVTRRRDLVSISCIGFVVGNYGEESAPFLMLVWHGLISRMWL